MLWVAQMRRHWITTFLAWLCFATAAAELYSLLLSLLGPNPVNGAPLYLATWRVLRLFPTPAVILWPLNLVVSVISPALISSKAYSAVSGVVTLVLSIMLGIAILRMRTWARAGLITLCVLTLTARLYSLFRLAAYSGDLLTVLQSNFKGGSTAYVAEYGPGSILASLFIAIGLVRLLIWNGLPSTELAREKVGPDSAAESLYPQGAHKVLLFATAAALVFQLLYLLAGFRGSWQELTKARLLFCIMLLPNVLIVTRAGKQPDRMALGLATGYGVLTGYIGVLFLPDFLSGLVWMVPTHEASVMLPYLLLEILPALQLTAAISALIVSRSLPPVPSRSGQIGLWGAAFVFPLAMGTAVPQFYFDWQKGTLPLPIVKSSGAEYHELMKQDETARNLVLKYGNCAFLYAKLHPEAGFPDSANLMGPGESSCLNQEQEVAHLEGYSFRYAAQRSGATGRFDRFTVAAQMNNHRQVNGVLMDEKGVLVIATSQEVQEKLVTVDQLWWNQPGLYKRLWDNTMPSLLSRIVTCARMLRAQSANGEFPGTLAEVLAVKINPNDRDCANVFFVPGPYLVAEANSNRATKGGEVLEYEPQRDASGKIMHFLLTLRPEHYAVDGVRSYLTDDSGIEHATSEDRSATSGDPPPLPCEVGDVCKDD